MISLERKSTIPGMTDAAIYARISQDRTGQAAGVQRQLVECRELAASLGLTVVAEYVDNDVSATKGKTRPEFERLLSSRPGAIIAWHQDRLLRTGKDIERVIDLGVNVYMVAAGTLDLSTPAGRAVARTIAAWSQYEGEQKAERQRAQSRQRAAAGLPHRSHRAYGWESDGITLREEEAKILAQMHRRIIQGDSIRSIGRWLNDAGIPTPRGKTWTHGNVRAALLRERNAGLLTRNGVIQPTSQIEPVVSIETWETVRGILTDSARDGSKGRRSEKWFLAGAMECVCGSLMGSKQIHAKGDVVPSYVCRVALETPQPGHSTISAHIAEGAVIERLRQVLVEKGSGKEPEDFEVIRLTAQIAKAENDRREAQDLWMLPGADKTHAASLIESAGVRIENLSTERAAVLANRAGASIVAQTRELIRWEVAFAKAAHPSRALRTSTAEIEAATDAIYADRAAWASVFDALDTDVKRRLVKTKLRVVAHLAKGRGYGAKRLEITPR